MVGPRFPEPQAGSLFILQILFYYFLPDELSCLCQKEANPVHAATVMVPVQPPGSLHNLKMQEALRLHPIRSYLSHNGLT